MAIPITKLANVEALHRPYSARDLARARGVNRTAFSLRELLTPQVVGKSAVSVTVTWENWLDDLGDHPAQKHLPRDRTELLGTIVEAARAGRQIRAVGSGHSHSKAAQPNTDFVDLSGLADTVRRMEADELLNMSLEMIDDIRSDMGVITPTRLKKEIMERAPGGIEGVLPDNDWLKGDPPGLEGKQEPIRIKAGTMLKRLNQVYLKDRGLALINMGSFDGQTLAGAINTSTHGTGARLSTLADTVLSVEMVTVTRSGSGDPLVQLQRIEPGNGITDREKFEADVTQHNMVLKQDDDLFHSAVVGYGCLGIVYAYTIKVVPAYWLEEQSELMDWNDLKRKLDGPTRSIPGVGQVPEIAARNRHFNFLLNTAQTQSRSGTDNPLCLVRRRWKVDTGGSVTERKKGFWEGVATALTGEGVNPEKDHPFLGGRMRDFFFKPQANTKPFGGENKHATASYIALRREPDKSGPREAPKPPPPAISTEIAVPATQVARAVDLVIDMVRVSDYFFAVPIGVRFVAPSDHYLTPEYGRAIAMVEVPFAIGAARDKRQQEILNTIAKPELAKIEQALRADRQLQGRPHLGKYNTMGRAELERRFPQFQKWHKVYQQLNPFGIFDNAFTQQLGL